MTDRQRDDEYIRARKLAYSISIGRLERIRTGSYVIKDIPEYLMLMKEHGFNPESREHCALISETLEQRLEQETPVEITVIDKDYTSGYALGPEENGIMVYGTTGMSGVSKELYKKQYKRIGLELKEIFREFYRSGIFTREWEEDIFNEPNTRYHLRIKSGNNELRINQVFKTNNDNCSHGLMDIRIKDNGLFRFSPYVIGYVCTHIMNRGGAIIPESSDFNSTASYAHSFYTKRSKMPNGDERLDYYFRFLRLLPEKLKQTCEKKRL